MRVVCRVLMYSFAHWRMVLRLRRWWAVAGGSVCKYLGKQNEQKMAQHVFHALIVRICAGLKQSGCLSLKIQALACFARSAEQAQKSKAQKLAKEPLGLLDDL